MALLCPNFYAPAQQPQPKIKLKIGDKIPDSIWHVNMATFSQNRGGRHIKLNTCKGKLIILDFWATWCGGCIQSFPKMDSIQTMFGNKIKLLLINAAETRDNDEKIGAVVKRMENSIGSKFHLPIIIGDSVLTGLFCVSSLPHCIWINKNGYVIGITNSKQITMETITSILKNENFKIQNKQERKF